MSYSESIEKNHKIIIPLLLLIIIAMLASCLFHDVIPICHYVFRCDHGMHAIGSL